jgi:hypothetical protein
VEALATVSPEGFGVYQLKKITTKIQFERWLKRQPLSLTFTQCCSGWCPLGKFSRSYVDSRQQYQNYRTSNGDITVRCPIPTWAQDFIVRFDGLDDDAPGYVSSVDSRVRALRKDLIFNKKGALFALRTRT